jgi:phage shock protein A
MNLAQRFTLLVKGHLNAVLDALEDPERSLNQLVLDMEEELDLAKRTVARAMANEDRMRSRIAFHADDARRWQQAAERALAKGQEADARAALRRVEVAERQRAKLEDQLDSQAAETAEVREEVVRMQDRCAEARSRLELVQARMRQLEARRAAGKVLGRVDAHGLHSEFDRRGRGGQRHGAQLPEARRRADRRRPATPLRGGRGGRCRRGEIGAPQGSQRGTREARRGRGP